jgi:hypothetical protein
MGDGAGGFALPQQYLVTGALSTMTTADLNRDGHLDLAVVSKNWNGGSSTVAILLGAGDGSFGAVAYYSGLHQPFDLAIADFNHDNNLDVAVADDPGVGVLLGDGMGQLSPPKFYATTVPFYAIRAGDFNGDSNLDLAVATQANTVSLLLADGLGGFGPPVSLEGLARPTALAVQDFDNDGRLDLAVANSSSLTITVLLNDCAPAGFLGPPVVAPTNGAALGTAPAAQPPAPATGATPLPAKTPPIAP